MRLLRLLSIIALLLLLLTSVFAQENSWQQYFDAGLAAYQKKDYVAAETQFQLALKEAIRAARKIKFTPGEKAGKPVSVHARLEFTFSLL